MVVDGDVQSTEARMPAVAAQPAVAALADLGKARHAFDIEVQKIARAGMLVAHHRGPRVQIAPPAQPRPAQHAAHRRRAQPGLACDPVGRLALTSELQHPLLDRVGNTPRTAPRTRTAIPQPGPALLPETVDPLACRTDAHASRLRCVNRAF